MWNINDYILINHAIIGDILQFDNVVFEVTDINDDGDNFIVLGMEMSWDEDVEFEIPDRKLVPLMVWS